MRRAAHPGQIGWHPGDIERDNAGRPGAVIENGLLPIRQSARRQVEDGPLGPQRQARPRPGEHGALVSPQLTHRILNQRVASRGQKAGGLVDDDLCLAEKSQRAVDNDQVVAGRCAVGKVEVDSCLTKRIKSAHGERAHASQ